MGYGVDCGYVLVILWECPDDVKFYRVKEREHSASIKKLREASKAQAMVNIVGCTEEHTKLICDVFWPEDGSSPCIFEKDRIEGWHVEDPVDEVIMVGFGL